ncbi:HTH-type transcriptional regulator [Rhynchospora pubera]|uniref:HTH-type transcriptional regulator n=1 Tax=Rhynchospora pubera TaxID=906938 RepID=A0AAV8BZT5_9POAL|nr:HTH-type transcriptional regulator [Rhynchospora pubera]
MGLTFSSENNRGSSATDRVTVRVITPDGSLRELTGPVSASDPIVNARETHFLCNSDTLYFDSEITPVSPTELLQPGQLYFMLPVSMQGNALSGIDMAALAVKASSALAQTNSSSNSRRRTGGGARRVRVAPDLVQLDENRDGSKNAKLNQRINEDTVMVTGTRSSVAATASVKAAKKSRTRGKKGTMALRRQLSIIMEAVE